MNYAKTITILVCKSINYHKKRYVIKMSSLKRKLTLAMNCKRKKENQNLDYTLISSASLSSRINKECFSITCEDLARFLLGKVMVRQSNQTILKGRIVETECYPGGEDKASHSYNGR